MSAFFLAFLGALLASVGARDQVLVATMRDHLGGHAGLLVVAWLVAIGSAIVAAVAGFWIGTLLPAPAKIMFVAIALLLSGAELAWPRRADLPREPTRSLGAIALVLTGHVLTDAARFLILAVAAALAAPALAAAGGALGGGVALTLGWIAGSDLARHRYLRLIRVGIAVVLGILGIVVGLGARGIV